MRIWRSTLREGAALVLVATLVTVVVVVALRADARTAVRTVTNDGGAWLAKGDAGVVGHVNRAAMEVSGVVAVADPDADFDIEQSGKVIVVHDRTKRQLVLVDPVTYTAREPIEVPDGTRHVAVPAGAVVWQEAPLRVWLLTTEQLASIASLDDLDPVHESEGAGLLTVTRSDRVVFLDRSAHTIFTFDASILDGLLPVPEPTPMPEASERTFELSAIGDNPVLLGSNGIVVVPLDGSSDDVDAAWKAPIAVDGELDAMVLAQPAEQEAPVVAVRGTGEVLSAPSQPPDDSADDGDNAADDDGGATWVMTAIDEVRATAPLQPIVHKGCVFALARDPVTLTRTCARRDTLRADLNDMNHRSLRLRLVNGWVWVNDLSTGKVAVVSETGDVTRLDDWGLSSGDGDSDEDPEGTPDEEEETTSDRVVEPAEDEEEDDEDDENQAPIAVDDVARTRVDTPVVVNVLDNDTDTDGDVLAVTRISDVSGGAQVAPTADLSEVQVTPLAGSTGTIEFEYEITDGRRLPDGTTGTDSARVVVEVAGADAVNSDPTPVDDRIEVVTGGNATLNVLDNDEDPDGDALLLDSVGDTSGTLVWDPTGRVTYTPPPTATRGSIDITYTARDTFGATSEATIEVRVRPPGSNNEPVASADTRATTVDRPIAFNVLANDSDADGDALTASPLPEPLDRATRRASVSLSSDGEFLVTPDEPGTYLWRYTITDGRESDSAPVRVEVAAPGANRQPTAVRDDVTIARGATRTVYALQNDTDPDGDVVSVDGWEADRGLRVEATPGPGFAITVDRDAPDEARLRYSISDGVTDPVSGSVIVAVSGRRVIDQPPVARPDVLTVRARRTASARVLLNDYDPEGGAIAVVRVADGPQADVRVGPGGQDVYVTPHARVTSSFSVAYDVVDAAGNTASSYVSVRPVPPRQPNRPPVARTDELRARAGTPNVVDVTRNDDDPDGDAVRVESIVAAPALGEATLTANGTVRYRASPDASGSDRFEYLLVDARGDKAIGLVIVGVQPATGRNSAPSATDDAYRVIAGSDAIELGVLRNDFDPNGDTMSISEVLGGGRRVAFDRRRGTVTFTPPATIDGDEQTYRFRYGIDDGRGLVDDATVAVTVASPEGNLSPVAVDDIVGPELENTSVDVEVLANDLDPDGKVADLTLDADDPAVDVDGGTLRINVGTESAEHVYTITDRGGLSAQAVVTVISTPNRAPRVRSPVVATPFETPVDIAVDDRVSDADGDALVFDCCTQTRHGAAEVVTDDDGLVVRFTPDDGFRGEAAFSFGVDDGQGHEIAATVVVTVLPPANSPPVARDGALEVEAGTVATFSLTTLVDDPDIASGDSLAYDLVDAGGSGATARRGTLRLSPALDDAGATYDIRYRATDENGARDAGTVALTVTESTVAAPSAVDDIASTIDTEAVTTDVVANDIDPLGKGLTVTSVTVASGGGSAQIAGDGGSVRYEPAAGVAGQATVRYTVQDARRSALAQAPGVLTVSIVAPPGQPPAPRAVPDQGSAAVTWQSPVANGSPIDGYEVASDQGVTQPASGSSVVFSGLRNGSTHRFRVRAANTAGWGEWSGWSNPVTPDREPGTPAAPTVAFDDRALVVTWQPPANDGSPISDYRLSIGGAGTPASIEVGNRTSYRWEGLTNGASYQFRVAAVNDAGSSPDSAWSQEEHPLRQPGPPGTPAVEVGDRSLALTWNDGDTGGDPIVRYEVQRRSTGEAQAARRQSLGWLGLRNGVAEQFRVRAFNRDVDPGAWSAYSMATTPCGVPAAPIAVRAARGDGSVDVAWDEPSDRGCAITRYTIAAGDGTTVSTQGTRARVGGLTNGTQYRFRVVATNSQGDSAPSADSNTVVPAGAPLGPAAASATVTGVGEITVRWDAAGDNGSPLVRYEVSVDDGAPVGVAAATTSWTHSGLAEGTTYSYKVRACNDVGCTASWSSDASETTWSRPSAPAEPVLSSDDTTLAARWSQPGTDGGAPVRSYSVRLDGVAESHDTTSTSWSGLQYGETYAVDVAACNAVGCSVPSLAAEATMRGAPQQVSPPAVVATPTTVTATWSQPGMNGGTLRHYEVDLTPLDDVADDTTTSTTYTFAGSPGTTYEVAVRACNEIGCGPWSLPSSATVPSRTVAASKGGQCGRSTPQGPCQATPPNCPGTCNRIHLTVTGFEPDTTYEYRCYRNGAAFQGFNSRTTYGDGSFDEDIGCFSGTAGTYYVTFGGVRSNDSVWT